jgi:hypothetical protein
LLCDHVRGSSTSATPRRAARCGGRARRGPPRRAAARPLRLRAEASCLIVSNAASLAPVGPGTTEFDNRILNPKRRRSVAGLGRCRTDGARRSDRLLPQFRSKPVLPLGARHLQRSGNDIFRRRRSKRSKRRAPDLTQGVGRANRCNASARLLTPVLDLTRSQPPAQPEVQLVPAELFLKLVNAGVAVDD